MVGVKYLLGKLMKILDSKQGILGDARSLKGYLACSRSTVNPQIHPDLVFQQCPVWEGQVSIIEWDYYNLFIFPELKHQNDTLFFYIL